MFNFCFRIYSANGGLFQFRKKTKYVHLSFFYQSELSYIHDIFVSNLGYHICILHISALQHRKYERIKYIDYSSMCMFNYFVIDKLRTLKFSEKVRLEKYIHVILINKMLNVLIQKIVSSELNLNVFGNL